MSGREITIGLVALVLVVFSLVVSIFIPRRDPGFPGRNLRVFVLVAALLVVGMLTAVEVLGETEHREGAEQTQGEPGQGGSTGPAETGGGGQAGDPAAGKQIFTAGAQPPCASCHTLSDASATGMVGPNLDEVLKGKDAAFIHESIVSPDAQIAQGFSGGIMPSDYGEKLDDKQLADLVAYLVQATQ